MAKLLKSKLLFLQRATLCGPPESIPDYLGLVGDTADGFPGLKGWGAKSASTILAHYHHIEQIPNDQLVQFELSLN